MPPFDRSKGRPEPIAALNKIAATENHEQLVDLRVAAPSVLIERPQVIPYLRKTVAEMLQRAAESLPTGYRFGVVDAWRPFDRQKRIYEMMTRFALEAWPDLSYAQLRRKVCRWVAPIDQQAPPGHCTGAAVDLWLIDDDGNSIDVTSPFGRFKASATYSYGLTPDAERNRMILVDAMLAQGFSNCRDEWWHYSYGDAGWAVRMGESTCFYELVELPISEYEEQEMLWIEAMKERVNPFL